MSSEPSHGQGSDPRSRSRCPICDGTLYTKEDGSVRCRNSLCIYNHKDVCCPRCGGKALKSAWFAEGSYHYSCGRCQNSWKFSA